MIKVHVLDDGEKRFPVCGRARIRDKSVKVYVGTSRYAVTAAR